MATQGFSARSNWFRCDRDQLTDLLKPYPNIEIRSRDDGDDETWFAIGTNDVGYIGRNDIIAEIGNNLLSIIDKRDTLMAIAVGFNGIDRLFGRALVFTENGVIRKVDLTDIYRLAGEAGIALTSAED